MKWKTATKTVSSIAIAAALGVTPAKATDLLTSDPHIDAELRKDVWMGLYGQIGGGYEIASADLGSGPDFSEDSAFGNFRAGYHFQRGRFVGGPWAEIAVTNISAGGVENEFTYGFGADLGIVIGNVRPYVLAGYRILDVDGADDVEGFVGGAGMDLHLGGNFFAQLEYTHQFEDDIEGVDVSTNRVMLGLSYKADPFQ